MSLIHLISHFLVCKRNQGGTPITEAEMFEKMYLLGRLGKLYWVQFPPPMLTDRAVAVSSPMVAHFFSEQAKARKLLKEKFRIESLRTNQLQTINSVLLAYDTFVLMATGGGKSPLYLIILI